MNQPDKTQNTLLNEIDRQFLVSSILAIIVLVISFFVISNSKPDAGSFLENAKLLTLALITNIIPVGLLFIGSYFLYRRIQQIKDSNQISEISSKVSEDVRSTVYTSVSNAFSKIVPELKLFKKM